MYTANVNMNADNAHLLANSKEYTKGIVEISLKHHGQFWLNVTQTAPATHRSITSTIHTAIQTTP